MELKFHLYLFCTLWISVILQLELYRFQHFFSGFIIQLVKGSQQIIHIRHTVFSKRYISGYMEFFRYVFTQFPSIAPFNLLDSVGYISSSVIAPEKGLAEHISFTSISNSFASLSAKSNRILESF